MHRRCKVVMLGAVHLEASPNNALERTVARPPLNAVLGAPDARSGRQTRMRWYENPSQ